MKIQAKLKLLRSVRGHKQHDLARLLDISIPAYSKIETGLTDLNFSRIEQLATLYGLTLVQLLDPDHDPLQADNTLLAKQLEKKLAERNTQVRALQEQLIALHQELSGKGVKKTA